MPPRHERATGVEMVKALCTLTETGFAADLALVEDCYGKRVNPAAEPGWFWIGATPRSAANIRRRGLHAVGTVMTTFIPPQTRPEVRMVERASIPIVGTPEHVDLMREETYEDRRVP